MVIIFHIFHTLISYLNFLFLSLSFPSLLQKTRANLSRVQQELKDREGVERELSHVKTWIHQSRELLLNPTADLDLLLQELEVRDRTRAVFPKPDRGMSNSRVSNSRVGDLFANKVKSS